MFNKSIIFLLIAFILLPGYFAIDLQLPVASSQSVQSLVDNTPTGGTLNLPYATYSGNVAIDKALTIDGHNSFLKGRIAVNGNNVVIRNLVFYRPVKYGLLSLGNNEIYENLTVLYAQLSADCPGCDDMDGIRIAGNNIAIKNIYIDNSGMTDVGPAHPDCIQFATWIKRASNIIVDGLYCENFYQAGTTNTGSNGFQLATEDYGWANITIKNSFLHTMTCILAYESQNGLTFEHNTCIGKPVASSYGFYAARNSKVVFRNNILFDHDTPVLVPNGLSSTGNNIIYCPTSACKSDSSFPHSGQFWGVNPQLDANYRPLPGSPACLTKGEYIGAYPCEGSVCTPSCTGKVCGDNGCGGNCGACQAGYTCTNYQCVATCTNECTTGGVKECSGPGFKTCGNYDADSCLEWSSVTACQAGQSCSSGICNSQSQQLPGLTWEAEAGTITAPFIISGGNVYQTTDVSVPSNGGKASYLFNINQKGDYVIKIILNASAEGRNSIYLNIDSEPAEPYNVWDIPLTTGFMEKTAGWRGSGTFSNNEFVPKIFTLSQGQHVLIVRGREKFTFVDKISIEKYTSLFGDVNNDGLVNMKDIIEIVKDFGKRNIFLNANCDVNLDSVVNLKDIVLVAKEISN